MEELPTPLELRVDQAYDSRQLAPRQVYYQSIECDSHTESATHFTIESPGEGYLLDAAVFVRYKIDMPAAIMAELYPAPAAMVGTVKPVIAMRQNYPIARCMRNCTVNINGQVVSSRPIDHIDAFNRVYMPKEESETIATMSAGHYDCGSYVNWNENLQGQFTSGSLLAGVNSVAVTAPKSVVPFPIAPNPDANWYSGPLNVLGTELDNPGFAKRQSKFYQDTYQQVATNFGVSLYSNANTRRAAANGSLVVTEPIPCSPLAFYARDFNKCIPHVHRMTLQFDWASNFAKRFFQSTHYAAVPANGSQLNTLAKIVGKPTVQLRWYRAPFPLPPQVQLSYQHIHTFYETENIPLVVSRDGLMRDRRLIRQRDPKTIPVKTFRLPRMPTRFLLYVKGSPALDSYHTASDAFLSISKLTISVDGVSGRLLGATPEQLYRAFLSHTKGCKPEFEEWYKNYCIIHLTPVDLGMVDTDVVPTDRPISINIQECKVDDFRTIPGCVMNAVGAATNINADFGGGAASSSTIPQAAVILYLVAIYDSRPFIVTENGSASLQL